MKFYDGHLMEGYVDEKDWPEIGEVFGGVSRRQKNWKRKLSVTKKPTPTRLETCEFCRHWEKARNYCTSNTNYGRCDSVKFFYVDYIDEPYKEQTDMLVYSDYEGHSAGFEVGKDFGCIHWEKLPNSQAQLKRIYIQCPTFFHPF